jgi:hypothetical protein
MLTGTHVIYIGREEVFRGLKGVLVEAVDRSSQRLRLHFQPESAGIQAVPCQPDEVRRIASTVKEVAARPEQSVPINDCPTDSQFVLSE